MPVPAAAATMMEPAAVAAGAYYEGFFGHPVRDIGLVLDGLRASHQAGAPALFLVGDSSVDNKHWLFPGGDQSARALLRDARGNEGYFTADAVNGYERILQPPRMVCDVTYWLNQLQLLHGGRGFALNCAVEATTLTSRTGGCQCCCLPLCGGLLAQDRFVRDNVRSSDFVVASVGGNDIALAPSIFTVIFLLMLMLTPMCLLQAMGRLHPAVAYFEVLFRFQVQKYISELVSRTKPRRVGVCMIYYLDEAAVNSWAGAALCLLCYNVAPTLLQRRLDMAFEIGTCRVTVPGTKVVPIALCEALDGRDSAVYCHRVEPSIQGGRKVAQLLLSKLGIVRFGAPAAKEIPNEGSMQDLLEREIEAQTRPMIYRDNV